MALIDKVSKEDLQAMAKLLKDKHKHDGKTKKMRKLTDKYGMNAYYAYQNKQKIFDKVEGKELDESPSTVFQTSTLLDAKGNVKLQWVKEKMDKDLKESIEEGILEFYHQFQSGYESIETPVTVDEDLLTLYPLPDMHWGLLTHGEELQHGENFNLKIQEEWVIKAMKYLVEQSPASETCIIADLGDLLHAKDDSKQTTSGHHLDVDGRHQKVAKIMFRAMTELVELALAKHRKVIFYSVSGNHSEYSGMYLKTHIESWFRNESRVEVVDSEKAQQYHRFGKCILGFTHGHELRPAKAGEVLVADNMKDISSTEHRYFHFGHYHKNEKDKSFSLCEVEIHANNIPRDKWADSMGFRGKIGEAKAIVYHKEFGELSRNRFNINTIKQELTNEAE